MISKYFNFILEKKVLDLILESKVNFGDDFVKILTMIKDKSKIANQILKLNKKEVSIDQNYISLSSDKNDTISFLSDIKVKDKNDKYQVIDSDRQYRTWTRKFAELGFDDPGSYRNIVANLTKGIVKKVFDNDGYEIAHFVTDDGYDILIELDALRKIVPEGNRSDMKVGRFAKRILDLAEISFTDKEMEEFVNLFKSEYDIRNGNVFYNFELVSGQGIANCYFGENYYKSSRGSLGNSCMRYDYCQKYLRIYTNNPDKVKLLVYFTDDGKVKGRALVWKLDQPDITFMDRIYCANDSDVNLFKEYAAEKKWAYKYNQNSDSYSSIVNTDEDTSFISTKLTNFKFDYYPYMDTLLFMTDTGEIHNNIDKKSSYMMKGTDGSEYYCPCCEGDHSSGCDECDGDGYRYCDHCSGGEVDCDKCKGYGKTECSDCNGRGVILCTSCDGDGEIQCGDCIDGRKDGLRCESCAGTGRKKCKTCDEDHEMICTKCDGIGKSTCSDCDGSGETACSYCDGIGKSTCMHCNGTGEMICSECRNVVRE